MSGENTESTGDDGRLEVGLGSDNTTTAEFNSGSEKPTKVRHSADSGQGMEFDGEGGVKATGLDGVEIGDGDEAEAQPDGDATEQPEAPPEGEAAEDLGDYDGSNAETVTKFNERYLTGDGLNMEALSAEVAGNYKSGSGSAKLNEGTYGWLKDTVGVSRETVDRIIAGETALAQQNDQEVYTMVGGEDAFKAKIGWAAGTYTPAQKQRFNAAMKAGGEEAREQLELLNTRFSAAGQQAPGQQKAEGQGFKGLQGRRPASPARTTSQSSGGGSGGPKPYANAEEHRKAQDVAMKSGDRSQIAEVEARLRASTFWRAKRS